MPVVEVDATLNVDDGGTGRPLSVDDLKTARTGAASEATLVTARDNVAAVTAKLEQIRLALPSSPETGLAKDATLTNGTQITTVAGTVTVNTELPSTVALSDSMPNPTTSLIGAATLGWDGTQYKRVQAFVPADGLLNAQSLATLAYPMAYNGASFDRYRSNGLGTLLASAARTATTTTAQQTNHNGRGVGLLLNVTVAGSGGLTVSVLGYGPSSGSGFGICTFSPIVAPGQYTLAMYPGATVGPYQVRSVQLPRLWAVLVQAADSSSWTYSIDYSLGV